MPDEVILDECPGCGAPRTTYVYPSVVYRCGSEYVGRTMIHECFKPRKGKEDDK